MDLSPDSPAHRPAVARRPLNRLQRAAVYGAGGVAMEMTFTGVTNAFRRDRADWKLQGHSYLWMLPLYGALTAAAYEPMHDALRGRSKLVRAVAYAAGIIGLEYASGRALKRGVGVIPWDYSDRGRLVLGGGATRLDYAPFWGVVGLATEPLSDRLRSLPRQGTRVERSGQPSRGGQT